MNGLTATITGFVNGETLAGSDVAGSPALGTAATAASAPGAYAIVAGPGACTVTASQAGDTNYLPAPDAARVVGVAPCDRQFADVAADDPACPYYGYPPHPLTNCATADRCRAEGTVQSAADRAPRRRS